MAASFLKEGISIRSFFEFPFMRKTSSGGAPASANKPAVAPKYARARTEGADPFGVPIKKKITGDTGAIGSL